MGRFVDLCGEVAEEADEGPDGLVLPVDAWERLRAEWDEEDIQDALSIVHANFLQSELVDVADSLSARLLEVLGAFGEEAAFRKAEAGQGTISLEVIGQLARRIARLEEVLEGFRERTPPDRRGFDALQRRLRDVGIEEQMRRDREAEVEPSGTDVERSGTEDEEE